MAQLTIPEIQAIQAIVEPIESKRFRVMETVRLIAETITKDRGYSTQVMEVSYDVKSWRDKSGPQTPVIYIIDDYTQITPHAGCVREYRQTFRLFGVYRDVDMKAFELFIADVEQCFNDNNHLCGQVNKCEVKEITTDNQLFSQLEGTHLFELVLQAEYTRHARNAK